MHSRFPSISLKPETVRDSRRIIACWELRMERTMVQVAVVGVGGWGKNLARTYFQIPECHPQIYM